MTSSLSEVKNQTFDYVIAGGGTAGLTLAARLTEDPSISVAVLEAGAANINDPALMISGQWGKHFGDPKYDWLFPTVPQVHANNKVHYWPRGKTLGGSSAINFFVWGRPPADDVNAWERLGNPGWNWKNFFEYSKKSETFHPPEDENSTLYKQTFNAESHGHSGPIHSSFSTWVHEGEVPFQKGLMDRNIKLSGDPYGGDLVGTYMSLGNLDPRDFTRSYATTGYYLPNKDRPNLKVLCNALVHKIITKTSHESGESLVIGTGLEFEYDGSTHVVHASRDVILSAGSLKSPQLLELSGIGDSRILTPLGIETIIDLPGVGANLQDHVWTSLIYELKPGLSTETLNMLTEPKVAEAHMALYAKKKGMHCITLSGFSWVPLATVTESPGKAKEIIYRLRKRIEDKVRAGDLAPGLKEQYDLQLEELETRGCGDCEIIFFPSYFGLGGPEPGKSYMSAAALLNHPFSRGTIHIGSKDPHDKPIIDPHYFEEEFDLELMLETLKFDRQVAHSEPFKNMVVKEVTPGPECKTDDDLKNHIKDSLTTTFPSTLSMLPREMNGVVDSKLRVYGTKNIRVVDLSIVPLHVAAHTQTTVYAIGEQAADIIKSEFGSK